MKRERISVDAEHYQSMMNHRAELLKTARGLRERLAVAEQELATSKEVNQRLLNKFYKRRPTNG
jgi:PHD/YefM family antitoxin component YafN of YafNO toxin-antitoxin module